MFLAVAVEEADDGLRTVLLVERFRTDEFPGIFIGEGCQDAKTKK